MNGWLPKFPPWGMVVVLGWACGDAPPVDQAGTPAADPTVEVTPPPPAGGSRASFAIRDTVGLSIEATTGGRSYRSKGVGECTHTSNASIYNIAAAQTRASYSGAVGEIEHLNVTLWQPTSGGPLQFGLNLRANSKDHQIATVEGGTLAGSGSAQLRREGSGGTITIEGRDAGDADLRVVVRCERFSEPVVEGG